MRGIKTSDKKCYLEIRLDLRMGKICVLSCYENLKPQ